MLKLYIGISLLYYSEVMMLVSTSEIQYRSHTLTYLNGPILCINHLPSHTAALYYHGDKNALGLAIMMICDVSSQQFQFEALLVPEQIGNTEWRVGMRTGGGRGRDQILICHLLLVAMETDDFFCTTMEPMGYRNGWGRNGMWVAGDKPSLRAPL